MYSPQSLSTAPIIDACVPPVTPQLRLVEGGRSSHAVTGRAPLAVRAQILCVAVVLALLSTGWALVDWSCHHRVNTALDNASYQTVTVLPGDSLWRIAERHPIKGCTTSELVHHIGSINQVTRSDLSVGMSLKVPVSGHGTACE